MNEYKENISAEELNLLPKGLFEGEIQLIDDEEQLHVAILELQNQSILGFDTETKPCFKKGESNRNQVSLLQLSTQDKAYLFRLNKIRFSQSLANILGFLLSRSQLKLLVPYSLLQKHYRWIINYR